MKNIFLILVCVSVLTKFGKSNTTLVAVPKEIEFKDGAVIEEKYFLPSVNISAGTANDSEIHVVTASLARVLNFYNTELLAVNWHRIKTHLSPPCSKDVEQYIHGLRDMKNWALKMDDASGRYSTGWFWGNHYWAGSQTLCDNIMPTSKKFLSFDLKSNYTRVRRHTSNLKVPSSPTQSFGYKPGHLMYTSLPPFKVSFFMLRINLNTSFTTEEKLIHVGLCLPHVCKDEDVKKIIEETSKTSTSVDVHVEAVRSEHSRFNLWQSNTFIILCVVTTLVTFLLIAGTAYDLYLNDQDVKKNIKEMNCLNYSKAVDTLDRKNIKLDMSMPDLKMKNGNCGLYVVNVSTKGSTSGSLTSTEFSSEMGTNDLIKSVTKELLLAFSLRLNINAICDQSVGSDTIPVIHGLKFISMAWVILGHTCIVAFKYSDNMEYRKVVQKEFLFQTVLNGALSVDTFFFTSGLLVAFLYFRTNAKGKLEVLTNGSKGFAAGTIHFIGLVLYRFARLTAPYLYVIGVVEVSMKWFNYNSIFEPPTLDHINCPKYWWRNVLYINTLFPVEEMCMVWSWYLSNDTQFYIIGCTMLILATRHFKSAASVVIIFIVSSWMTTGYIAYSNSHVPNPDDPMALFDKIYDKPWTRLGPYLIGMSVGWFLFKTDCQIRMSKLTVVVGWLLSIACLLSLVYGLYDVNLSPVAGAAYSSLSHSAWALGLAWIVIACCTGYGGFANTVLSSTVLYPFSRVTYCAYLLHPIVIRVMTMSMDSPLHLGSLVMIIIYLGQVVASYILAFIVSLAFEAPVVGILRFITKSVPSYVQKHSSSC